MVYYEIIENNGLLIIGTGAVANANHVKQVTYFLQVSVSAIYSKLKEVKEKKQSALMPLALLETKIASSQTCNYWYLILKLQVDFLLYIRSIRESNFQVYFFSIKNLMKCI